MNKHNFIIAKQHINKDLSFLDSVEMNELIENSGDIWEITNKKKKLKKLYRKMINIEKKFGTVGVFISTHQLDVYTQRDFYFTFNEFKSLYNMPIRIKTLEDIKIMDKDYLNLWKYKENDKIFINDNKFGRLEYTIIKKNNKNVAFLSELLGK